MKKVNYYKSLLDLKKSIAFVLGGSGLIGKEIVLALLSNGAKVVSFDIKSSKIKHSNFSSEIIDVRNIKNASKLILKVIKKTGTPKIFINCSYPKTNDWTQNNFKKISIESYKQNIDIHLNSYVLISRLVAEQMAKKKQGSIILFGSIYGIVGQDFSIYKNSKMTENLTYSAIKGGIVNNTRLMASYYGKYNIRVNTICPGGLKGNIAGVSNKQPEKFIKQYSLQTPLKRMGKPEEIAASVLFLASDASSYITGTTFMVDGGWTAI